MVLVSSTPQVPLVVVTVFTKLIPGVSCMRFPLKLIVLAPTPAIRDWNTPLIKLELALDGTFGSGDPEGVTSPC